MEYEHAMGAVVGDSGAWAVDRDPKYQLDLEARAQIIALRNVLAVREEELLSLKGPCRNKTCRLHYAHSGPCDERI
jgi:hypothetical protein